MLRGYLFVDHLSFFLFKVFVVFIFYFYSISKITCAMVLCLPMEAILPELHACWFSAYEIGLSGLPADQLFLNQWRHRYGPCCSCPTPPCTPVCWDQGRLSPTALTVHGGAGRYPVGTQCLASPSTASFEVPKTLLLWILGSQVLHF